MGGAMAIRASALTALASLFAVVLAGPLPAGGL